VIVNAVPPTGIRRTAQEDELINGLCTG